MTFISLIFMALFGFSAETTLGDKIFEAEVYCGMTNTKFLAFTEDRDCKFLHIAYPETHKPTRVCYKGNKQEAFRLIQSALNKGFWHFEFKNYDQWVEEAYMVDGKIFVEWFDDWAMQASSTEIKNCRNLEEI